jgi:hypothetical protein
MKKTGEENRSKDTGALSGTMNPTLGTLLPMKKKKGL